MRAEVIDGKFVKRFAHNLMARGGSCCTGTQTPTIDCNSMQWWCGEVLPEKVRSVMMTNELCTASGIKKCRKWETEKESYFQATVMGEWSSRRSGQVRWCKVSVAGARQHMLSSAIHWARQLNSKWEAVKASGKKNRATVRVRENTKRPANTDDSLRMTEREWEKERMRERVEKQRWLQQ